MAEKLQATLCLNRVKWINGRLGHGSQPKLFVLGKQVRLDNLSCLSEYQIVEVPDAKVVAAETLHGFTVKDSLCGDENTLGYVWTVDRIIVKLRSAPS